jgi:hypothetical protein
VEGSFGEVSVDAKGAASVHIAGLEQKATLSLSGLLDVAVTATNAGQRLLLSEIRPLHGDTRCQAEMFVLASI